MRPLGIFRTCSASSGRPLPRDDPETLDLDVQLDEATDATPWRGNLADKRVPLGEVPYLWSDLYRTTWRALAIQCKEIDDD